MLSALINWSIRNLFLVLALTTLTIGTGVYALLRTPLDAIPDLSDTRCR